jgi:hypothetical protein
MAGLFVAGAANAISWHMDSVLTGGLGSIDLASDVTFDGTYYTYAYQLTATSVIAPVHGVDIGNPYLLAYTAAANTGATYAFNNPTYKTWLTSVTWSQGEILPGHTATFTYKSIYKPIEGDVTVLDHGTRAYGRTWVMVPEPSTVGSAAVILLGLVGVIRRRPRK